MQITCKVLITNEYTVTGACDDSDQAVAIFAGLSDEMIRKMAIADESFQRRIIIERVTP